MTILCYLHAYSWNQKKNNMSPGVAFNLGKRNQSTSLESWIKRSRLQFIFYCIVTAGKSYIASRCWFVQTVTLDSPEITKAHFVNCII